MLSVFDRTAEFVEFAKPDRYFIIFHLHNNTD